MRIRDERVTWRTTSQEETAEILSLLGPRRKKEVIKDQLGDGDYILISKDAYLFIERKKRERKQQLMTTRLQDGTTALDYVQSKAEADQPWVAAGILSCIEKGYSLNRLTINWEARDLRYGKK